MWKEAENYTYADRNPYVGREAILMGVFARIGGDWDGSALSRIIDGGDTIVSLGHCTGTSKATGKPMRAQFAKCFRVEGGKIVSFQQYADTLGAAIALGR
ncbi:MAG: nuclear transport factor 2 family protein [Hyphomonadaceae bacterium]